MTVKADGGQTAADTFSRSFSVYVRSPANAPPTISAIADQAIDEDTQTEAIAFTIGDDNTPANLLTVATRSSNTNLVPNGNIILRGAGSSRTVTVLPALNQSGTSKITISVTDRDFGFSASSFVLQSGQWLIRRSSPIFLIRSLTKTAGPSVRSLSRLTMWRRPGAPESRKCSLPH